MNEGDIKDNPSLKNLRRDADKLRHLRKAWPLLRPIAKALGVDITNINRILDESARLVEQVDEMTDIPDRFNQVFSDRGWILFDCMDLEAAQQAVEIAEQVGVDEADRFLVEHFSPEWVEAHLNLLRHIKGFQERFELAKSPWRTTRQVDSTPLF